MGRPLALALCCAASLTCAFVPRPTIRGRVAPPIRGPGTNALPTDRARLRRIALRAGKINPGDADGSTGWRGKGGDYRRDQGGATSGGAAEAANIEAFRQSLLARAASNDIVADDVPEDERVSKSLGEDLGDMREKRDRDREDE